MSFYAKVTGTKDQFRFWSCVARKTQEYIVVGEKPDYERFSHCINCKKNYPKSTTICPQCGGKYRVRYSPKHNRKVEKRYIE